MSALKPCPFCGSPFADVVESADTTWGDVAEAVFMAACNCGVTLEWELSKEAAVDAWNRRHDDPQWTITDAGRALIAGTD